MDWGVVAQAIFFLASALLAVTITIFVFAASLLGRAVEAKSREEEELRNSGEKELELKASEAQKELEELKNVGMKDDSHAGKALAAVLVAEASKAKYGKESKRIIGEYSVFTARGGVVYPAIFFLSSIILNIFAWSLAATKSETFVIGTDSFLSAPFQIVFIIASLLLLGIGIKRLIISLEKIQKVAITSEEAALKRNVEAFKIAQRELESENKPELKLSIVEPKQPIRMAGGSEVAIKCELTLVHGKIAEHVQVFIMVPTGFSFTDTIRTYTWGKDYIGITEEIDSAIISGVIQKLEQKIKAPTKTGKFNLVFYVVCKDYSSDFIKVGIQVI